MKIRYHNPETVDCTADPHVGEYPELEQALEDLEVVCSDAIVDSILSVSIDVYLKGEQEFPIFELESDRYTNSDMSSFEKDEKQKAKMNKVVTGDYAKKHKIEGLYWREEPGSTYAWGIKHYQKEVDRLNSLTDEFVIDDNGKRMNRLEAIKEAEESLAQYKNQASIVKGLLPGLTGVKTGIEALKNWMAKNWNAETMKLNISIGVQWKAFMDHNCSDYINLDYVNGTCTVDYSNQDWYRDNEDIREEYEQHVSDLESLVQVSLSREDIN